MNLKLFFFIIFLVPRPGFEPGFPVTHAGDRRLERPAYLAGLYDRGSSEF